MLRKINSLLLIASFLQFSLPLPVVAQDTQLKRLPLLKSQQNQPAYVEGEVIVKYKSAKKKAAALDKIRSFKDEKTLRVKDEISDLNIAILQSDKKSTADLINELKKDTTVEYAEPNYRRELAYIPNDIKFSSQWSHNNTGQLIQDLPTGTLNGTSDADIDAVEMWDIEASSASDTIVAVIDDGVDYNHSDLIDNMWDGTSCVDASNNPIGGGCPNHGWDFYTNSALDNADPFFNEHGTFVSSIIAARTDNGVGMSGTSRYNHTKIMALEFDLTVSAEIKAINFAKNNGAKVINASFVGDTFSQAEKEAIDAFPGIVVAAAGNDAGNNDTSALYPCSHTSTNIICVGSSDQNDALSSFSNYGTTSVDMTAPGESIIGIYNGEYYIGDGTSFAAPFVTGIASSLYSKNPSASIANVRDTILLGSDQLPALSQKIASGRRLNANTALQTMPVDQIAPTISNIATTAISTTGATINFTTNQNVLSTKIDYGTTTAYGSQKNGSPYMYSHAIELTSLLPNTTYHFKITAEDYAHNISQSSDWTFTTTSETTPIYRFWSDKKQGHFFTASASEKDSVIANDHSWSYEGVAYNAFSNNASGTTPIYRFWSEKKQHHFFTASASEKDHVIANDPSWAYEGIAYYAYASGQLGTTAVYRFWSDAKQGHFFTASVAEKDSVIANDHSWRYEGIAWYVPTN